MKKKMYISGPISGIDKLLAFERFREASEVVKLAGWTPINPMAMESFELSWSTYMQIAIDLLKSGEIDGVYMLRGWMHSRGAAIEWILARRLEIPIYYQDERDRGEE